MKLPHANDITEDMLLNPEKYFGDDSTINPVTSPDAPSDEATQPVENPESNIEDSLDSTFVPTESIKEEVKTEDEINHDWKKRYDDSKKYIDELKAKLKTYEGDKTLSGLALKTKDELLEAIKRHPESGAVIESMIELRISDLEKNVSEKLSKLEETQKELTQKEQLQKFYKDLLAYHPDAKTIQKDAKFIEWVKAQKPAIKRLFTEDADAEEVAQGLTLYKVSLGIDRDSIKTKQAEASTTVVSSKGDVPSTQAKYDFTEAQIRQMSSHEKAKYAEQIHAAYQKGRVLFN